MGNTDAEGRLILCDALAEAAQWNPDMIIDAATLTGAARTALGPELPAVFCSEDELWESLAKSSDKVVGGWVYFCYASKLGAGNMLLKHCFPCPLL